MCKLSPNIFFSLYNVLSRSLSLCPTRLSLSHRWSSHDFKLVFDIDIQTTFSKADRLIYGESAMTHAMVFTAVSVDVSIISYIAFICTYICYIYISVLSLSEKRCGTQAARGELVGRRSRREGLPGDVRRLVQGVWVRGRCGQEVCARGCAARVRHGSHCAARLGSHGHVGAIDASLGKREKLYK